MARREHKPFTIDVQPPAVVERHYAGTLLAEVQPQLLAENARNAAGTGTCGLCGWRYARNARVANLPDGGVAHVQCIARAAP